MSLFGNPQNEYRNIQPARRPVQQDYNDNYAMKNASAQLKNLELKMNTITAQMTKYEQTVTVVDTLYKALSGTEEISMTDIKNKLNEIQRVYGTSQRSFSQLSDTIKDLSGQIDKIEKSFNTAITSVSKTTETQISSAYQNVRRDNNEAVNIAQKEIISCVKEQTSNSKDKMTELIQDMDESISRVKILPILTFLCSLITMTIVITLFFFG